MEDNPEGDIASSLNTNERNFGGYIPVEEASEDGLDMGSQKEDDDARSQDNSQGDEIVGGA